MWHDILIAMASLGFSPGELLGIGSVWAAIWRLDRRVKVIETAFAALKGSA